MRAGESEGGRLKATPPRAEEEPAIPKVFRYCPVPHLPPRAAEREGCLHSIAGGEVKTERNAFLEKSIRAFERGPFPKVESFTHRFLCDHLFLKVTCKSGSTGNTPECYLRSLRLGADRIFPGLSPPCSSMKARKPIHLHGKIPN